MSAYLPVRVTTYYIRHITRIFITISRKPASRYVLQTLRTIGRKDLIIIGHAVDNILSRRFLDTDFNHSPITVIQNVIEVPETAVNSGSHAKATERLLPITIRIRTTFKTVSADTALNQAFCMRW